MNKREREQRKQILREIESLSERTKETMEKLDLGRLWERERERERSWLGCERDETEMIL